MIQCQVVDYVKWWSAGQLTFTFIAVIAFFFLGIYVGIIWNELEKR